MTSQWFWKKKLFFKKARETIFSNNACEEAQCVTLIQGVCWAEVGRGPEPVCSPLLPCCSVRPWGHFCGTLHGLKTLLSKDQKRVSLQLWSVYFAKINLNLPNLTDFDT